MELPKVYVIALLIAAALHLLCMEKVNEYLIAYNWQSPDGSSGSGSMLVTGRGGDLVSGKAARALVERDFSLPAGDVPQPGVSIVLLSVQRMDYRWEWKSWAWLW